MQLRNSLTWAGGVLFALSLTACSEESLTNIDARTSAGGSKVYDQVEFLGNPLVSEVTILKARHDAYNRTMPYAPSAFQSETEDFIVNVAGRERGYAQLVSSVLYATSDMLIVDSSNPGSTAGWLRWAAPINAVYNGGNPIAGYGGRLLTDDVVDIGLYAIFSSLLSPVNASCAPGSLPLCTDNVGSNDKPFLTVFPYVAAPSL